MHPKAIDVDYECIYAFVSFDFLHTAITIISV